MSAQINLPPEVIEAILLRLPAKSLGRFKSVSKPWFSLISDPQFIQAHLDLINHHKTSNLILVSNTKSIYSLDISKIVPYLNDDEISITANELSFRPPSVRWKGILGSCNGLVLAIDEDDTIYLMNPTTRDLSKVPISPLEFPIKNSEVMYGFTYDSSNDDYKVITISFLEVNYDQNPDCTDMFVSIYNLTKNSWRKLHNPHYNVAFCPRVNGVLINGNLHWLINTFPNYSSTIIAFSLANEEFTEIELPDSIDNTTAVLNKLVAIGGKVGLFGNQVGNDLWVMEEYGVGESWTKVSIHGVEIDPVRPVCSVDDSNRDIVLGCEDGIVVYNVNERVCRNVRFVGVPIGFAIGGTYVQSLVSPKCIR